MENEAPATRRILQKKKKMKETLHFSSIAYSAKHPTLNPHVEEGMRMKYEMSPAHFFHASRLNLMG